VQGTPESQQEEVAGEKAQDGLSTREDIQRVKGITSWK